MAKIPVTHEWVLMNLSTDKSCDVNNQAIMYSSYIDYAKLIEDAINLAGIGYNTEVYGDDTDPMYFYVQFTFNIDDIQYKYPNLYTELLALKP